ncbi:MAG: (d)CMP kinase [Candidatus Woesearchaeota archaeon]
MIITISGLAGSGKSTVAKLVAQKLGCNHYSAGDLQRELANEHNLTIKQWGELEARDEKYDKMVDDRTVILGKTKDNFVMDGWLAPKFIPHSIKVFLTGEEKVRAQRRLNHKRQEEQFTDINQTIIDMRERIKCNRERWLRYYNYDLLDERNYDFVIDTTNLSKEEVAQKILDFVHSNKN